MTQQPIWKFLDNLGDKNPLEYGGYFIFEDTTGVYFPEGEIYNPDMKDVYRFSLDKLSLWSGHLIPYNFHKRDDLPHKISDYIEWFDDTLNMVAKYNGILLDELQQMFTTDDILVRAQAYRMLGEYHGFDNLNQYPLALSSKEAKTRYNKYLK